MIVDHEPSLVGTIVGNFLSIEDQGQPYEVNQHTVLDWLNESNPFLRTESLNMPMP
jgi:hypothetical protein